MTDLLYVCEICGTFLEEYHCRASCPNCGRTLDCSDLPGMPATGALESGQNEIYFIPRACAVDLRAELHWNSSSPSKNAGAALRAGLVLNEEDGGEAHQEDATTAVR